MVVFATLESVFAVGVGCKLFGLLMRTGNVAGEICADCADSWSRSSERERDRFGDGPLEALADASDRVYPRRAPRSTSTSTSTSTDGSTRMNAVPALVRR